MDTYTVVVTRATRTSRATFTEYGDAREFFKLCASKVGSLDHALASLSPIKAVEMIDDVDDRVILSKGDK